MASMFWRVHASYFVLTSPESPVCAKPAPTDDTSTTAYRWEALNCSRASPVEGCRWSWAPCPTRRRSLRYLRWSVRQEPPRAAEHKQLAPITKKHLDTMQICRSQPWLTIPAVYAAHSGISGWYGWERDPHFYQPTNQPRCLCTLYSYSFDIPA
jgi:hypothetical protein